MGDKKQALELFDNALSGGVKPDPINHGLPDRKQFDDILRSYCISRGVNFEDAPQLWIDTLWDAAVKAYRQGWNDRRQSSKADKN